MVLGDIAIIELARAGMITPYVDHLIEDGTSYGLSSSSYDIRLASLQCSDNVVPAGDKILGVSVERFVMPRRVMGLLVNKSTPVRAGLWQPTTQIEAGWQGYLTFELFNGTREDIYLGDFIGKGIASIIFSRIDPEPAVTYADRKGKYMDQPQEPVSAIFR